MTYETNTQDKDPRATFDIISAMKAQAEIDMAYCEKRGNFGGGWSNTKSDYSKKEYPEVLAAITAKPSTIKEIMAATGFKKTMVVSACVNLRKRCQIVNTVTKGGLEAIYKAVED